MKSLTALAVSIGIIAAIVTWLALGPLSAFVLIWVVFVAWACFFAIGGDNSAFVNTIVCTIFGSVVAWIAAFVILNFPGASAALGLPVWAGIVVGATCILAVLGANIPALATVPATVLGYAASFAFLLQTPDKLSIANLMSSVPKDNVLITVAISMIVGAICGLLSGKLAAALTND